MSEKKDELTGLKKVLERYSYLDDVINQLSGLNNLIDQTIVKTEAFLRRRDASLKTKKQLLDSVKKHRDEIIELSNYIKGNFKNMSSTDRRMKAQELIDKVRTLLEEIDGYASV